MRRFVLNIILTLLFFVAAATVVVFIVSPLGMTRDEKAYKAWYLNAHANDIGTLLLGHSQFANGFNPYVLDSAFTLAISAQVSYYDAALLASHIDHLPNLKAVIFPLIYEYEPGYFYIDKEIRLQTMYEYKRLMHVDYPQEYSGQYYDLSYLKKYIRQSLTWSCYKPAKCDSLGYHSLGDRVTDSYNIFVAPNCQPRVKASLMRMAQVCHAHGVRLIVVTPPCNSTYLRICTTAAGIDSLYALASEVGEVYPIEYHCYLGDTEFANDSLFYNQNHLNHPGATRFARRVKADFGL